MMPLPVTKAVFHACVTVQKRTKKDAVPACSQTCCCGVSVIDGGGLTRPGSHAKLRVRVVKTDWTLPAHPVAPETQGAVTRCPFHPPPALS